VVAAGSPVAVMRQSAARPETGAILRAWSLCHPCKGAAAGAWAVAESSKDYQRRRESQSPPPSGPGQDPKCEIPSAADQVDVLR
jgi:hypothetical protein